MTRVKICGLTTGTDLKAAVDAGADAVGVVAAVPVDSPREVDPRQAAELVAAVPPFVTSVLVTMGEDVEEVADLVRTVRPDVLQFHGAFDAEAIRFLRAETGVKVVPAVDYADGDRARDLDAVSDALLVDSTDDVGAGGTGETGDWGLIRDLVESLDSPVVLAGGLTPENVAEAVAAVDPYGVDVASGVERDGGVKDHEAVRAFVREARRAEVVA